MAKPIEVRMVEDAWELSKAYYGSSNNTDFNEGYRDGCRAAARDLASLALLWEEQLASNLM